MEAQLAEWRVKIDNPKNSEEVIISQVGWKLYDMFFKNYTRKQWQRDAKQLDPSVCGRIPIRTNRDDRYLSEKFQALPKNGYTSMFQKMLSHPKIEVWLNTDYREVRKHVRFGHLIFTGPIDRVLRPLFRSPALPLTSFRTGNLAPGIFPAGDAGKLPKRLRLYSHRGNQTRYRTKASRDNDRA